MSTVGVVDEKEDRRSRESSALKNCSATERGLECCHDLMGVPSMTPFSGLQRIDTKTDYRVRRPEGPQLISTSMILARGDIVFLEMLETAPALGLQPPKTKMQ